MAANEPGIAIKVDHVSKEFKLPYEKVDTLKSAFTGMLNMGAKKIKTLHALNDISFEVKEGEFFGIVGRNGSGKSTLLKILANIYQPTEGKIYTKGKLVPFIELGVGFNPELTGKENVYLNGAMLGFSVKEVRAMYDDIVEFAELAKFMDQKLKNYSSGMHVRLAFSMATRANADILLVDEVLAVGDADFQRKCFDYFRQLKKNKKTVVLVTHDMGAIREYCDRAVMIEDSHLIGEGQPSKIATMYSRLFTDKDNKSKSGDTRWGNGVIKYTDIKISPSKIKPGEPITLTLTAKANETIERPIFGFLIKNAAFFQICGSNSKVERIVIEKLNKGQTITVEWKIPNIFNDGTYYVDPAIVYKGGTEIADWWEEAANFTIYKEEKTPYVVYPDLEFKYSTDK